MSWWRRLLRERRRLERELSAELADHIERHVADLVAAGVAEPEARRRAQLALGGVEQVKEACRDERGTRWLEDFASDLRYAGRGAAPEAGVRGRRRPLAGAGDRRQHRPLLDRGQPDPAQPAGPRARASRASRRRLWTNPIWEQIRDGNTRCSTGPPRGPARTSISRREAKRSPSTASSSAAPSSRSSACPAGVGRTILPSDDRGMPRPTLGRGAQRRILAAALRGDPGVVGRTLRSIARVHDRRRDAARVPRAGSRGDRSTSRCRSRLTRSCSLSINALDNRSYWWLEVVARRKHGQSLAEATDALRAVQAPIRTATLPERGTAEDLAEYLREPFQLVPAATGTSALRDRYRRPLFTILAVAFLVLLVACANVANLQLARGNERQHEFRCASLWAPPAGESPDSS